MIKCATGSARRTERVRAALSHSRVCALIVRVTALHDQHNVESESVIGTVDDGNVESRQRIVSHTTGRDRVTGCRVFASA